MNNSEMKLPVVTAINSLEYIFLDLSLRLYKYVYRLQYSIKKKIKFAEYYYKTQFSILYLMYYIL